MLSFVVTAYNSSATLGETVASIAAQHVDLAFELVVVDDGSTDGTRELIRELAGRHEFMRFVFHEENRGNGAARNTAIAAAQGDLIRIVDSDNVMPPGLAQAELDELRSTGMHAVSVESLHLFKESPGDSQDTWPVVHEDYRVGLRELFRSTQVPPSHGNYLFTRELYEASGGYEDAGAVESWTFGFKHVVGGFPFAVVPGTHYDHRHGHDSLWVREERLNTNNRNALAVVSRFADRLPEDIRVKVERLHPEDPFQDLVNAGCFSPEASLPAPYKRLLARSRRRYGRMRVAAGAKLGR